LQYISWAFSSKTTQGNWSNTPIGQSLLKLDESQRKRLESLLNNAYSVVKAGKPFSDYELICEIQVKNGLDRLSCNLSPSMRKFLVPRVRASFLSDKCGNFLQYLQYISWAFSIPHEY
jgi:hypothetical protein